MEWQPMETAPKDGTKVILYGSYQWENYVERKRIGIVIGFWDIEDWRDGPGHWQIESTNPYADYVRATHWMPLPEAPVT